MMIRKLPTALVAASLLVAGSAWAQDESGTSAPEAEATAEATETPAETLGAGAFPRISDDEETIYSVQRKAYLMDQKFELAIMPAFTFTDRFVQAYGGSFSATYYVAENFGLKGFGTVLYTDESSLTDEILEAHKLTPQLAKLTQLQWGLGLGAQWSPIYGKIEIFGEALGNFSFFVGAGAGIGQTRVKCTPATMLDPEVFGAGSTCDQAESTGNPQDAYKVVYEGPRFELMGVLSGGVLFSFSNSLGIKLEVADWIAPARVYSNPEGNSDQTFTNAIRNNVLVQIGASFLFGGEDN